MAQLQREKVIPGYLIQVSIGSKIWTFNLLSLKNNFTWGFSDKSGSMNDTLPIAAQISIIIINGPSDVYKEVGPWAVYFKQTKAKFHKHQPNIEGIKKGYQICCTWYLAHWLLTATIFHLAGCFGCHSTDPSSLALCRKSSLVKILVPIVQADKLQDEKKVVKKDFLLMTSVAMYRYSTTS